MDQVPMFVAFAGRTGPIRPSWPEAGTTWMVGNGDMRLGDIVFIIRLGELVTDARVQWVRIAARLPGHGHETRIHRDADDVVSRRNRRLSIASVKHEVLSSKKPDVLVCPTGADAL